MHLQKPCNASLKIELDDSRGNLVVILLPKRITDIMRQLGNNEFAICIIPFFASFGLQIMFKLGVMIA